MCALHFTHFFLHIFGFSIMSPFEELGKGKDLESEITINTYITNNIGAINTL